MRNADKPICLNCCYWLPRLSRSDELAECNAVGYYKKSKRNDSCGLFLQKTKKQRDDENKRIHHDLQ